METIRNYLDNMFAGFNNTADIIKLKEDLYAHMEDKYNELKYQGKSENEAIGIVISEFGNIDELTSELNIAATPEYTETLPVITKEVSDTILHDKRIFGNIIAIGTCLCIMAPAVFLLVSAGDSRSSRLALLPLFFMVAFAVALFIFSGIQLEKYDYLKKPFRLDYNACEYIRKQKKAYQTSYTIQIILGVMLCILSPLEFIGLRGLLMVNFTVPILLISIASAVFLFIHAGSIMNSYNELLQEKEFSKEVQKSNKLVSIAGAIVWPISAASYLIFSFYTGAWHISWIIFPIVGIFFGVFASVVNIVKGCEG